MKDSLLQTAPISDEYLRHCEATVAAMIESNMPTIGGISHLIKRTRSIAAGNRAPQTTAENEKPRDGSRYNECCPTNGKKQNIYVTVYKFVGSWMAQLRRTNQTRLQTRLNREFVKERADAVRLMWKTAKRAEQSKSHKQPTQLNKKKNTLNK